MDFATSTVKLAAHERAIGGDLQALPVLVGAGRQMDAYVPACERAHPACLPLWIHLHVSMQWSRFISFMG